MISQKNKRALEAARAFDEQVGPLGSGALVGNTTPKTAWATLTSLLIAALALFLATSSQSPDMQWVALLLFVGAVAAARPVPADVRKNPGSTRTAVDLLLASCGLFLASRSSSAESAMLGIIVFIDHAHDLLTRLVESHRAP